MNVQNNGDESDNNDLALEYIINFEEIAIEDNEKDIHNTLATKFGKQFFCNIIILILSLFYKQF